jgi:hypothetical protein
VDRPKDGLWSTFPISETLSRRQARQIRCAKISAVLLEGQQWCEIVEKNWDDSRGTSNQAASSEQQATSTALRSVLLVGLRLAEHAHCRHSSSHKSEARQASLVHFDSADRTQSSGLLIVAIVYRALVLLLRTSRIGRALAASTASSLQLKYVARTTPADLPEACGF